MDVRVGHAAWWDRRDIHRELRRTDVLRAHAGPVQDVIPAPAVAAAPDDRDPVAALHAIDESIGRIGMGIQIGNHSTPPSLIPL